MYTQLGYGPDTRIEADIRFVTAFGGPAHLSADGTDPELVRKLSNAAEQVIREHVPIVPVTGPDA